MESITERQQIFIEKLLGERDLGSVDVEAVRAQIAGLTSAKASAWITKLLGMPFAATSDRHGESPANQPGLAPGVYEMDDVVYVVKPNRERTRLYAKRLVEIGGDRLTEDGSVVQIEFEYEAGAIYRLRPEHKMPLERAKALTIRYGRCIVCGRRLRAAESVERGIGPVCIRSFA